MRVVVCGAGQVGRSIAAYLSRQNFDVAIIDQSQELIDGINQQLDVQGFVGKASEPEVLRNAGLDGADILIAVTQIDEVNMIACQVAHSIFDTQVKIARIRDPAFADQRWSVMFSDNHLPVDMILNPEYEVAQRIAELLKIGGCLNLIPVGNHSAYVVGVRCHGECPIINTPLRELTLIFPDLDILILGIIRKDGTLITPSANDQMLCDDVVYFSVSQDHLHKAMDSFGISTTPSKSLRIVGGGKVGNYLMEIFDGDPAYGHVDIHVLEPNPEHARALATRFSDVSVFNGSGLDVAFLAEHIHNGEETLIAITNFDQTNILTSILARKLGARRTMLLISDPSIAVFSNGFDVDVPLAPEEITLSKILHYLRVGAITKAHVLYQGAAELLEADILETMPIANKSIQKAKLPKNTIVGAILRDNAFVLPKPDTVIIPGDQVIFFVASSSVRKLEKLVSVGVGYF